eukprot:5910685-Pleurochrysis_carterae.AAC.1
MVVNIAQALFTSIVQAWLIIVQALFCSSMVVNIARAFIVHKRCSSMVVNIAQASMAASMVVNILLKQAWLQAWM